MWVQYGNAIKSIFFTQQEGTFGTCEYTWMCAVHEGAKYMNRDWTHRWRFKWCTKHFFSIRKTVKKS